jgi:hypothetical protein
LAASPDAIVIIKNPDGNKVIATVEVKTRVSLERITEAERIAAWWNHKLIICIAGTDDIEVVMDNEHTTRVMIQMAT